LRANLNNEAVNVILNERMLLDRYTVG